MRRQQGREGAVLMLVLWAVVLLSAVLLKVHGIMRVDVDQAVVDAKTLRARLVAESGLALARHPEIKRDSTLLRRGAEGDVEQMEVVVQSEGARLNVNRLLAQDSDGVLVRLLGDWGLSREEAEQVRDRWADWVDADDLTRLDGAEREEYRKTGQGAYPLNRPFQSLEEAREVAGVAALLDEKHPGWESAFTVHGDGRLDLQDAPADLIAAVCEVSRGQAELLVKTRRGRDGKDGTKDDLKFGTVTEALRIMGLGEVEGLEARVAVGAVLLRVESAGVVGGRRVTITEIAPQGAESRQVLARWERAGGP